MHSKEFRDGVSLDEAPDANYPVKATAWTSLRHRVAGDPE